MDEDRFQSGFVEHAIWTYFKGPFASLAYCGEGLTIQRYEKLEDCCKGISLFGLTRAILERPKSSPISASTSLKRARAN
jgi:hypothetical protein